MLAINQSRSYYRERGRELLGFWAESMQGRIAQDSEFRDMLAAIPPPTDEVTSRADRPPTHVPEPQMRVLLVESAFKCIGMESAAAVYGSRDSQSPINLVAWEAYANHVRKNVRALCVHVLVGKLPIGKWEDEQTFALMAQYGVARRGFSRWITDRFADVEQSVGRFA